MMIQNCLELLKELDHLEENIAIIEKHLENENSTMHPQEILKIILASKSKT